MQIFEFKPPIKIHTELNPKLWKGEDLRLEVNRALMRIAGEFYKFLDVRAHVKDVLITGSQVNFNYGPESDLDLHLVIDFSEVECEIGARELFDTKRKLWKEEHNITVHGVEVECYVEDVNDKTVSSTYSLTRSKWLVKPERQEIRYDINKVKKITRHWEEVIDRAIATKSLKKCEHVRKELKQFRQDSLNQDGELGLGNLAFKALRNSEYIGKLMAAIRAYDDQRLSI
jgi:hypothetical protein